MRTAHTEVSERRVCRLQQEFITLYTLELNGLLERLFRSLKEECVWQHRFDNVEGARQTITRWITWYNAGRPRQALPYQSPQQYRQHRVHGWLDFWGAQQNNVTHFCVEAMAWNGRLDNFTTDQGLQFVLCDYISMLKDKEIKISMDGKSG